MAAFSSLKHFGDNFGNEDVVRQTSFFLNQRDKIAMATSARGVGRALQAYLPTATSYVTTVKPNLLSAFAFCPQTGVYSSPISTFEISEYGCFGNSYQSMITHVGANEDRDYYSAWYEANLGLSKGAARNRRNSIDLYIRDLPAKDESRLVEGLCEAVDTRLSDHHCLPYTREIMEAIVHNTSIVDVLAYSQISSCRCVLVACLAEREADITTLRLGGGICHDATLTIGDECVQALTHFSFTTDESDRHIECFSVDYICEALADVGILQVLEIGNVDQDYNEWADGLIRVMDACPLSSVRINEADFMEDCVPGMVRVFPFLTATDLKLTSCEFGGWATPVFDALFANTSIRWLDLSYTKIGSGSIRALVDMIKRGTLVRLAVGGCGIGRGGISRMLGATTHADSKLEFISIFDNNAEFCDDVKLDGTSLKTIHTGGEEVQWFTSCEIDARDCDDCCDGGGGVWPWVTKSHVWYQSHEEFLAG